MVPEQPGHVPEVPSGQQGGDRSGSMSVVFKVGQVLKKKTVGGSVTWGWGDVAWRGDRGLGVHIGAVGRICHFRRCEEQRRGVQGQLVDFWLGVSMWWSWNQM